MQSNAVQGGIHTSSRRGQHLKQLFTKQPCVTPQTGSDTELQSSAVNCSEQLQRTVPSFFPIIHEPDFPQETETPSSLEAMCNMKKHNANQRWLMLSIPDVHSITYDNDKSWSLLLHMLLLFM